VVKFKSGKILKQKIKQLSLEKLRSNPPLRLGLSVR